jgi:flagellar motor switch/type III secretory pathway protein FliN
MATLHTAPLPAGNLRDGNSANQAALVTEEALIPLPQLSRTADVIAPNSPVARLPVELDVTVPVREFRVRNLLALQPDMVIESQWDHDEDVPLGSGEVQLAWSEFEVVDTQLAVRITRLA